MQVNDLDKGPDWKKFKIPILKQHECSFDVSLNMKISARHFLGQHVLSSSVIVAFLVPQEKRNL